MMMHDHDYDDHVMIRMIMRIAVVMMASRLKRGSCYCRVTRRGGTRKRRRWSRRKK
jgi:hypothetical protein